MLLVLSKGKGMQSSSEQLLVGEERYVTNLKTATDMEFNLDFMKLFSLGWEEHNVSNKVISLLCCAAQQTFSCDTAVAQHDDKHHSIGILRATN